MMLKGTVTNISQDGQHQHIEYKYFSTVIIYSDNFHSVLQQNHRPHPTTNIQKKTILF